MDSYTQQEKTINMKYGFIGKTFKDKNTLAQFLDRNGFARHRDNIFKRRDITAHICTLRDSERILVTFDNPIE